MNNYDMFFSVIKLLTEAFGIWVVSSFLTKFAGEKLTLTRLLIYGGGYAALNLAFSFLSSYGNFLLIGNLAYFLWWSGYCVAVLKKKWSFSAAAGMILLVVSALLNDIAGLYTYLSIYLNANGPFVAQQIITILILPVLRVCEFFILRFINRNYRIMAEKPAGKYLYIMLFPCAMFVLLIVQNFGDILSAMSNPQLYGVNYEVVTKSTFLIGTAAIGFFIMLSAFQKLCDFSYGETEKAVLLEQVKSQKIYIQESKRRYEENRSLQHDMKNHLLVLSRFISEGNNDEAQTYLDKLKIVTDESALQVNSGNLVVDILLSEKISHAIRSGITVSHNVHIPPKCSIDDFDLCVIFSNALDNALAACTNLSCKPYIEVNTGEKNRFFLIEFRNSCDSSVTIHEGTGLRNIRKIAEEYGGTVDIEIKNEAVCLSILLCLN